MGMKGDQFPLAFKAAMTPGTEGALLVTSFQTSSRVLSASSTLHAKVRQS